MSNLEEKALDSIRQYDLIHQGDRIAVGVSGGADSVALLAFLHSVREEYHLELVVCHLNHCLRGAESDRDEESVRALAKKLSQPFECRRVDVAVQAAKRHCSTEMAGREARYAFLSDVAGQNGLVATAHTLSDSMETLLLNLTRGTGLRGLCGIPWRRGNVIRPLLDCTRVEIEEYVHSLGLNYVNDSSNAGDDYTRNKIRHHVLPELYAINPALPESMSRLMRQLSAQWMLTESLADTAQQQLAAPGGELDRQGLLALPEPVGDRLLLRMLERWGLPLSADVLERMRRTAESGGRLELARRSICFVAEGERVWIEDRAQRCIPTRQVLLPLPEQAVLVPLQGGRRLKLTHCCNLHTKDSENFNNCPLKNRLDCDKIRRNLIIRSRLPGDSLTIPRRGSAKLLKNWYSQEKIPAILRDRLAVLADEEGLLWTEAFGADTRACADDTARDILIIEVLEEAD